jgi:hypothetical protein
MCPGLPLVLTMSITKTLFEQTRSVPETGETGWGLEVTTLLVDLIDWVDAHGVRIGVSDFSIRLPTLQSIVEDGDELSVTGGCHVLYTEDSPCEITLGDGEEDGQTLVLRGNVAMVVSVLITSNLGAGRKFNGDVTLWASESISLRWDGASWVEESRSM